VTRRALLAVVVVVAALVLQVDGINRLHLPGGHPDLLLVSLVSLALVGGPSYGAVVGFAAGLAADLVPPADHAVGRLAFVYAIVGYLAGLLEDAEERSVVAALATVAAGSVVAVLLYAGLGALLGDARVGWASVGHALAATSLYDVVLTPFVVPLVSGAARRVEPEVTY
jgi:rod shape-determining protein MreD